MIVYRINPTPSSDSIQPSDNEQTSVSPIQTTLTTTGTTTLQPHSKLLHKIQFWRYLLLPHHNVDKLLELYQLDIRPTVITRILIKLRQVEPPS